MSYIQVYYHIVFSTKNRIPALREEHRHKLYNYLWGVLRKRDCHLYRMGGVEDHIHIFTSIHSKECLSDLIRDLKTSSSKWIKHNKLFPLFEGWQSEYGAFTKSHSHKERVIEYIKRQKEHHDQVSFIDEFKRLLTEEGISFDDKHLH